MGRVSSHGQPAPEARVVGSHAFGREVSLARTMTHSPERVLVAEPPASPEQAQLLLALYEEVCASWRALVDVRFKLLGLVPAVSAVALATLLVRAPAEEGLSAVAGIGVAGFGLAVTLALLIYDQRNSQLHDELISRGRRIEYELAIEVGQFRGRPGSWSFVKHDLATQVVYAATLVAWVFAAAVFVARAL